MADQAEQLLVSEGILIPQTELDLLKLHIKTVMYSPARNNELWVEVLTKLNRAKLVMDILEEMTVEEFNALPLDAFTYKPPGMDVSLLEIMASNPLVAEDIFGTKFIAEKNGSLAHPLIKMNCEPYSENELQVPESLV